MQIVIRVMYHLHLRSYYLIKLFSILQSLDIILLNQEKYGVLQTLLLSDIVDFEKYQLICSKEK